MIWHLNPDVGAFGISFISEKRPGVLFRVQCQRTERSAPPNSPKNERVSSPIKITLHTVFDISDFSPSFLQKNSHLSTMTFHLMQVLALALLHVASDATEKDTSKLMVHVSSSFRVPFPLPGCVRWSATLSTFCITTSPPSGEPKNGNYGGHTSYFTHCPHDKKGNYYHLTTDGSSLKSILLLQGKLCHFSESRFYSFADSSAVDPVILFKLTPWFLPHVLRIKDPSFTLQSRRV
jgi:hypothetical protein